LSIDKNAGKLGRRPPAKITPVIITNVIKKVKKQAIFYQNRLNFLKIYLIFWFSALSYVNFKLFITNSDTN
jgi:hypothetical protein